MPWLSREQDSYCYKSRVCRLGCRNIDLTLQSEDVEGGGYLSQTLRNEMGFVLCGDQLTTTSGAVEAVWLRRVGLGSGSLVTGC